MMILGEEARRQAAGAEDVSRVAVQMATTVRAGLPRDASAAKHRAEEEVGRRRRTVPVLTSLVGLCVLGAAIIVWLTMPAAPGPMVRRRLPR